MLTLGLKATRAVQNAAKAKKSLKGIEKGAKGAGGELDKADKKGVSLYKNLGIAGGAIAGIMAISAAAAKLFDMLDKSNEAYARLAKNSLTFQEQLLAPAAQFGVSTDVLANEMARMGVKYGIKPEHQAMAANAMQSLDSANIFGGKLFQGGKLTDEALTTAGISMTFMAQKKAWSAAPDIGSLVRAIAGQDNPTPRQQYSALGKIEAAFGGAKAVNWGEAISGMNAGLSGMMRQGADPNKVIPMFAAVSHVMKSSVAAGETMKQMFAKVGQTYNPDFEGLITDYANLQKNDPAELMRSVIMKLATGTQKGNAELLSLLGIDETIAGKFMAASAMVEKTLALEKTIANVNPDDVAFKMRGWKFSTVGRAAVAEANRHYVEMQRSGNVAEAAQLDALAKTAAQWSEEQADIGYEIEKVLTPGGDTADRELAIEAYLKSRYEDEATMPKGITLREYNRHMEKVGGRKFVYYNQHDKLVSDLNLRDDLISPESMANKYKKATMAYLFPFHGVEIIKNKLHFQRLDSFDGYELHSGAVITANQAYMEVRRLRKYSTGISQEEWMQYQKEQDWRDTELAIDAREAEVREAQSKLPKTRLGRQGGNLPAAGTSITTIIGSQYNFNNNKQPDNVSPSDGKGGGKGPGSQE